MPTAVTSGLYPRVHDVGSLAESGILSAPLLDDAPMAPDPSAETPVRQRSQVSTKVLDFIPEPPAVCHEQILQQEHAADTAGIFGDVRAHILRQH